MGLFNVFKKKEAIDPQQTQFQKVYSLVSNEKFNVCYNHVASRILNATTYRSTSTLNSEVKAVLEERKNRENESIDANIDNIDSINDVKKMTDRLFSENMRPEIVCTKIITAFKQIGMQNHIKPHLIDEFCEEIKKLTNTFDEAFMKCVNVNEESHQRVKTMSNQAYAKRTSTGLEFGILTSSIGTATLYSAMNAHEHKRQLNAQSAQINNSVNALDKGSGEVLYSSVMELYNAYQKDINAMLISVQAILGNKDKLQEAEEKIKQSQAQKRKTIIQSMSPTSRNVLRALYKAKKSCSITDITRLEGCMGYSIHTIADTVKCLFNDGLLKRVAKQKKWYYSLNPEGKEIIKITEKTI